MSFIDSTVEAIDQRIAHTQDEIAQLEHVRTILLREGNPAKRTRAPKASAKPANGSRRREGSRPSPEIDSDAILRVVKLSQPLRQSEIRSALNLSDDDSRPLTARLRKLVADGQLQKQGQTRHAVYSLA